MHKSPTPEAPLSLRQECRKSRHERWCFVCGGTIPEGQGVAQMHLGMLTHSGACSAAVGAEERLYDRSPRGRWRPVRDVLQRLQARRPSRKPPMDTGLRVPPMSFRAPAIGPAIQAKKGTP
jgi:hypothetical protein